MGEREELLKDCKKACRQVVIFIRIVYDTVHSLFGFLKKKYIEK